MSSLPSLFVSHGAPDLPLRSCPAREFLKTLGSKLDPPQAIVVVSAHWGDRQPCLSIAPQAQAFHDFYGFSAELGQLHYRAPGAPEWAEAAIALLSAAGIATRAVPHSLLDHGAWEPLLLMYPEGSIPVTQLAIQPNLGPEHHLQVGRALSPLRHEGILILASGSATHNLGAFGAYPFDASPVTWAEAFDDWLAAAIARNAIDDLLNYRQLAPHAARNHPTEDHLLSLFVALGAGGPDTRGHQIHASFTYGVLSMAAYAFN